ncbi:helix-turn-helix transcriptional regulator [Belliella kenyensis]|uniref:Helix-turn-helix transcriptional regulator n=1 Tax=Belliella kenyensis TaxID=1472724 RepID=A0ABV8EKT8_9BACT|nr:hypothetical protein [Belliella kenyensis]MCH7403728.1 hypothetical protein [Belliella kenyensis]MDN3602483.1 hypothetical protein [Belliella kenyensis]
MGQVYNTNQQQGVKVQMGIGIEAEDTLALRRSLLQESLADTAWIDEFRNGGINDLFIVEFEKRYPRFVAHIELVLKDINMMDLKACCLMRLDFSTKDIAVFTKSSIRAVESRKYRIRKRLGITSNVDLNMFLIRMVKE